MSTALHHDAPEPASREWLPEGVLAGAVLVLGLLEAWGDDSAAGSVVLAAVVLGVAGAVLLSRHAPATALGLVWAVGGIQVLTGAPILAVEVAVAAVAFGCARWGHPATVVLSGLSIPGAAGIVALLVAAGGYGFFRGIDLFREVIDSAYRFSDTLLVGAAVLGMLVLALPWLAGLVLRMAARAQRSRASQVAAEEDAASAQRVAAQAQEIARLRDDQARLATDVHDVVGHSLAVILAQAESAQYLADDPDRLKATLATIATSARSSLRDVRTVLSATHAGTTPAPQQAGDVTSLVEGIRATGHEVVLDEVGTPQPLPPELAVVAHRVLQEMLTNAVKHGDRSRPIEVERHWPAGGFGSDLRIEVRNAEPAGAGPDHDHDHTQPLSLAAAGHERPTTQEASPQGQGLEGMRRRLESVGGRIDVRRRQHGTGTTFTVTAWVPVRTAAR